MKPKPIYPINAVPTVPTITYNPNNPELRKWLRENYHILEADTKMKKKIPQPPSVVFRQPPNLNKRLGRSSFKEVPLQNGEDVVKNTKMGGEVDNAYSAIH